jgi:hypothetical protein
VSLYYTISNGVSKCNAQFCPSSNFGQLGIEP